MCKKSTCSLLLVSFGFLLVTSIIAHAGLAPIETEEVSSHAPYSDGQCEMCHDLETPAGGDSPGKVPDDLNAVCAGCHFDLDETLKASKVVHEPINMGCTTCHNPHSSNHPHLLLDQPPNLCLECHGDIQDVTNAKIKHQPVTENGACLNCHTPHASDTERLLTVPLFDLCLSCHSQENWRSERDGRPLTNFGQRLADANLHQHYPVADKDCGACHLVHGSDQASLLAAAYPAGFYSLYDPENYALCFNCHDPSGMAEPETATATNFRDGSRNLHYLHVNKSERGRTCRACHEVHAAENNHQIRKAVPYGPRNWPLSLNYTETATGGSCAKTCHQTKTYDNTRK